MPVRSASFDLWITVERQAQVNLDAIVLQEI